MFPSNQAAARPPECAAKGRVSLYACLRARFLDLPRTMKQAIAGFVDIGSALLTVWLAFSLHYESPHHPESIQFFPYMLAPFIAVPVFLHSGLYRALFRYSGFAALSAVLKACTLYGALFFTATLLLPNSAVPPSIGILQPMMLLLAVGGSRAAARYLLNTCSSRDEQRQTQQEKILIYGAGSSGAQIAGAMQHNTRYQVAGFLDDNPELQGKTINGVTIHNPAAAADLVRSAGIAGILLAIPSAPRCRREEVYRSLLGLGINIRTLPGIDELAEGSVSISDIREVEIEDLLGRDPVPPDHVLISRCIAGKTVLVTGAGGSIGSEICRQIMALKPSCLVLVEQSEYNLYALNHELLQRHADIPLVPVLGDVTDRRYMRELCSRYQPETVYHAAAYKHVPLVEHNPAEGLRNNVFGTLSMVEAALDAGVDHFVLVSTDKAVRPTNVMGASKRMCELVLQAFAAEHREKKTCFSMVRFGNVLGSSGSVIPLFRQQIRKGGPVTVTHADVTRFFMTIPEATQLVIQSGAMASGGEVYLLDMGEPVRIIDLARRMVELSGLTIRSTENPNGDIDIQVTGLRPGEKLYEELLISDTPIPTAHSRIFKAREHFMTWQQLEPLLQTLAETIAGNDVYEIKYLLHRIVPEYKPEFEIGDVPVNVPEREKTVSPGPEVVAAADQLQARIAQAEGTGPERQSLGNAVLHSTAAYESDLALKTPADGANGQRTPFRNSDFTSLAPNLTVLIVEDDNVTSMLLKHLMKGAHVNILQAANGRDALKLVGLHPEINLVLMDLVMPVMDGFEATRQIKQRRPDLPIIIQTAHPEYAHQKNGIMAACDGLLSKPIHTAKLFELMQGVLDT